jgi:hypothetical protein
MVATDYAGTALLGIVTLGVLTGGLVHRSSVSHDDAALRAAVVAGEAYIGHHAPRPFRDNATASTTVTIEHGRTYRTCAPNLDGKRAWCVIVREDGAAPRIRYAGNEPNWSFAPIRDLGDH